LGQAKFKCVITFGKGGDSPNADHNRGFVTAVTLNPRSPHWLWLFPLAYLLHAIEEVRGVGALHGINLSLTAFLILSTAAWLLMVCGVVLALRFGFPQFMEVCVGTTFFLNGLSHILRSLLNVGYDAGVISGSVIFIPLGLATLISVKGSMPPRRYLMGVVVGIGIQAIATILAA
jgi:hypothetical protein